MTLHLVDTTDMDITEFTAHWPDILACLQKYCERFPDEETVEHLMHEVATGDKRMWLILDENDRVVLVPVTAIQTMEATGIKQLFLAECAGSRLAEAMPLLYDIEDWARREHNIDRVRFVGRRGWSAYLMAQGYHQTAVIFEKEFDDGQRLADAEDQPDQRAAVLGEAAVHAGSG
jgi:hypothetical protein